MPKFKRKPSIISAEQYHDIPNGWPRGVCACCDDIGPRVHTMHDDQVIELENGDWVVPEPDGIHFYPIKDKVFTDRHTT